MEDSVRSIFYNLFWTDELCQSFFLHHRSELLKLDQFDLKVTKRKYYSHKITLSSAIKNKAKKSKKTVEIRTKQKNLKTVKKLQNAFRQYFNEESITIFMKENFSKTEDKILTLIDEGDWMQLIEDVVQAFRSESDFIEIAKEYYLLPRNINESQEVERYILQTINEQLSKFLKRNNIPDILFSVDNVSKYYDLLLKQDLMDGNSHVIDILRQKDDFKNREQLFDTLYEIGVLIGAKFKTYYECLTCPQGTFSGLMTTNMKPSSAKRIKCPRCKKSTYYLIPYYLNDEIFNDITSDDGILLAALEYFYEEKGIEYLSNYNIGGREVDICLLNNNEEINEIIEVKIFKTNNTEDAKIGNIRSTVGQVKKTRKALSKLNSGFGTIQYSIITNYTSRDLLGKAKDEVIEDLRENNILLYNLRDFRL